MFNFHTYHIDQEPCLLNVDTADLLPAYPEHVRLSIGLHPWKMDENWQEVRLSDFTGKKLVLYFYPKDMTSGCTAEACNLRDNIEALSAEGYAVVGASVDDAKSHQKFIAKHELPFSLIADTDKRLVEEFGVWGEKSMYGRKYFGTFRTTFIINEEGIVERIIGPKKIKTKDHARQILSRE